MSISVENLSKNYGTQKALNQVSFSINKGEIVGFLGPNGAGKSTLMKILTTSLTADNGVAKVNGFDVVLDENKVQKIVGYLPEHNPLYLEMYVTEYLEFNALVYKISKNRINEVIELTGLLPEKHKKIKQLSKGYRQRVGLATALLHDPEVLILDEPTTGLDPNQLTEIRELIKNIGKNKTVFLSTHIMQEVEAICDRVIIINKGKIVTDNQIENLLKNKTQQIIEVEFDKQINLDLLQNINNLVSATNYQNIWTLTFESEIDERTSIFDFAQQNQLKTLQIVNKTINLEGVFKEVTKN